LGRGCLRLRVGERNRGILRCEAAYDAGANSFGSTCDESNFTFELQWTPRLRQPVNPLFAIR
jgi:hypothetical protein